MPRRRAVTREQLEVLLALPATETELIRHWTLAAADLAGSRKTGYLIRTQLLPQSEALLRSGIAGFGLGKTELADVLRAEHDLANLRIQLLNNEFDQQRQLAMIERLIGGDL